LRFAQKEETKKSRKRGKLVDVPTEPLKQTRLDCFGIAPRAPKTSHKYGNGQNTYKNQKRSPMMNIVCISFLAKTIFCLKKLPLIREVVPEGMLPEDPFTSFYEHEKDEKSKEEKQKVEDEQQKNSQNSIICLEEDEEGASTSHYSPPLPPTPEDVCFLLFLKFKKKEIIYIC